MALSDETDEMVRGERPLPGCDRHMGFRPAAWDGCATLAVDRASKGVGSAAAPASPGLPQGLPKG